MLLAVLSGFGAALLVPLFFRRSPQWAGRLFPLLPLALFVFFLSHIGPVSRGEVVVATFPWIPSLGISFALYLDGLGMLFALLVTGIGFLVFLYTPAYLGADRRQGTLFAWLFAFMAAMLGTTLAGNLVTLFVFWELTGLCSYLLIGFDHEAEASRKAALQALLVTGGGLALLAGFLLLGKVVGSMELPVLLASGGLVRNSPLYLPILLLMLLGAFTKSAQFPFHFWLPNAMAAPTPVSAYLHSATMVKLGIYLIARFSPLLAGTELWLVLVAGSGALTMLIGGLLAILEHDLKRILAWSTVSALGSLVLLFGVGTPAAVTAALLFLLTHALYKSALFLVAGALDHGAGSRDIRELGGLVTRLPWLAVAAILAALAMAGLPPLFGFIAKESIYTATLAFTWAPALVTGLMLAANALMVTVAVMTGVGPFFGKGPPQPPLHDHHLPATLWLAPLLPAALGLLLGFVPDSVATLLLSPAIAVVQAAPVTIALGLWHGFNLELLLSVATLTLGFLVVLGRRQLLELLPLPWQAGDFVQDRSYQLLLRAFLAGARWQTLVVQNGRLRYYLMATIGVAMGLMGLTFLESGGVPGSLTWPSGYLHEWLAAAIIVAGALTVTVTDSRLGAVAALGTVGYGVSLVYILYGAPDLAMTQFCIETLAIVLFVLVLYRLPLFTLLSTPAGRLRDAAMAAAIGGLMTLLMLYVLSQPLVPHVSDFFLANSLPAAHGRNVVNVILVDFRALDTLGEITVLAVAAIGVFGLLKFRGNREEEP